ncbi:MAG: hypothetical protein R2795_23630 [Saprospiraceae bacterium]
MGKKNKSRWYYLLLTERIYPLPPAYGDTLLYAFGLEMEQYQDGEQRNIPVYRKGSQMRSSQFIVARGDTTIQWDINPLQGPLTLRIGTNSQQQLEQDITYLKNYPYLCNEQSASKLMALLV